LDEIVLQGHLAVGQDEFLLLPFRVPPGIGQVHVAYEISDAIPADKAGWGKGNIVDVGLFDPRGATFPTAPGFRGWSGSFRNTFTVGAEATPGYLSGPIPPGDWCVLLGLYQLTPQGCDYCLVVRLTPDAGMDGLATESDWPLDPTPIAQGPRWFRGDLHAHSHHSDGTAPLTDLVAATQAQGLDFLAVTEHNTVSHLPALRALAAEAGRGPAPLLLIPGMEVTTYHGHANVWPVTGWTDFRCQRDEEMRTVRELARERGALFSVNHPKDGGPPWKFGDLCDPDCIEVWGAPWFTSNYQSLAVWDRLLRAGRRVTGVGGSDKHQGPFNGELGWYEVGTPTTWVWADELSIPAIAAGLQAGRVLISAGPAGPHVTLTAEVDGSTATIGDTLPVAAGETVRLTCRVEGGAGGLLRLVSARRVLEAPISADDFTHRCEIAVEEGERYVRAEVIDPPEAPLDEEPAALIARALGNPIYLSERIATRAGRAGTC
jgi:hypothetical protein